MIVHAVRSSRVLVLLYLVLTTACHRYETVNDLRAVVGARGRLTLSAEGRGSNVKRLGGVATDIDGVLVEAPGDSIGIKADEVHFSDLGSVPFAQGELHFAAHDVSFIAKQVFNRKKTTVFAVLAAIGILAVGQLFSPSGGLFGSGRNTQPPQQ